jgi:1,2-diacylglycerol 3-alpha-glucosyltransferase
VQRSGEVQHNLNIGLFTESYVPQVNGVANLVRQLKHGLEHRGHTVHVFTPRIRGHRDDEANIHRLPVFASFDFVERLLGLELDWQIPLPTLRRHREVFDSLDIVHTHHMFGIGLAAARLGRRRGIPILFTNHTNYRAFEAIVPARRIFALVLLGWFKLVSRLSTCVISPGEKMQQQLRDYGIKKEIVVVPNAVEVQKFERPSADAIGALQAKHGLRPSDKVLLYVGRLSKEKNLGFLIRSLRTLLDEEDALQLLLVGDGTSRAELERAVRSHGLAGKTTFAGYVPYAQIHTYYYLGDIFVTASLSEVFPLTVIEALSASLPVVAIDAVGTGDIVQDGETGILVDEDGVAFRDAVITLIDDDELRRKMGENARESVQQLAVDNCVDNHLILYERLAAVRRKPGGIRLHR